MKIWLPRDRRERRAALGIAASLAMVGAIAVPAITHWHHPSPHRAGPQPASPTSPPRAAHPTTVAGQSTLSWGQRRSIHGAVARLRAMPRVPGVTSVLHPPVSNVARRQPDLYAEAFTRLLLTQNYRSNRQQLLEWVQSESAGCAEPTVVGLTPPSLRSRMAVASVQGQPGGGPAPVPSPARWAARGRLHGYTTVHIERVVTPIGWGTAVAAGRITDPGVTAREVDATVTLHTIRNGQPSTSVDSVALTMNLEGPPVRAEYGFVTAVTYTVVGVR
jgi:hypothetical protein